MGEQSQKNQKIKMTRRERAKKLKMINNVLIFIIFAVGLARFGSDRASILTFSALCALHAIASAFMSDNHYYIAAAVTDSIIISILSRFHNITTTVIHMQTVALYFIVINAVGWGLYHLPASPIFYDIACFILYIIALSAAARSSHSVGNNRHSGYNSLLYLVNNSWRMQVSRDQAQKET